MSGNVIQHRALAGKSGDAWRHAPRWPSAVMVTLAGLAAATWLSIVLLHRPAPPPSTPRPAAPAFAPPAAQLATTAAVAEINVTLDLAGPPRAPRRARASASGVPLDAAVHHRADDYEILSAAELASISQAHD